MSLEELPIARTSLADDPVGHAVPAQQSASHWNSAISITVEVFGVMPEIGTMVDPEDEEEQLFTVFTVRAFGGIEELVDKRFLWHDRVEQLGLAEHPRLSIIPISQ